MQGDLELDPEFRKSGRWPIQRNYEPALWPAKLLQSSKIFSSSFGLGSQASPVPFVNEENM